MSFSSTFSSSCSFDKRLLCYSGCLIGLSSYLLFCIGIYHISYISLILFITTINHWRDYQFGWKRRIDMTWVNLSTIYTGLDLLIHGNEIQNYIYACMILSSTIFYAVSLSEIKVWPVFHMALHIYAAFFIPLIYGVFL